MGCVFLLWAPKGKRLLCCVCVLVGCVFCVFVVGTTCSAVLKFRGKPKGTLAGPLKTCTAKLGLNPQRFGWA